MATIEFGLKEGEVRIPLDQDKPPIEASNGFYGSEAWVVGEIDIESHFFDEHDKIRIDAEFISPDKQRGPQNPHTHSRVGIWLPTADVKNTSNDTVKKEYHCVFDGKLSDLVIVGDSWKFGKTARLEFKKFNREKTEPWKGKLKFQTCIVPCFSRDPEDSLKLRCKIIGYNDTTPVTEYGETILSVQRKDDWPAGDQGDLIDTFLKFGAYHTNGAGMSLHPKQLLTVEALRRLIYDVKEPVSVCYIGPDTTENICSLLRVIGEDNNLKDGIKVLNIYSWENWDEELFNRYGVLEDNILSNNHVAVKFHRISSEQMPTTPLEEEVITIATYVTPWATEKQDENEEESENKASYKELLNLLLHNPKSRLISVDPMNGDSIARSALHSELQNLNDFYKKDMKLKAKTLRDLKFESTVARVWSKIDEVT
jgi:hypothetical protein